MAAVNQIAANRPLLSPSGFQRANDGAMTTGSGTSGGQRFVLQRLHLEKEMKMREETAAEVV